MFSKDDADKIINYGRLSYENGFKDGYFSGLVTGSLLTMLGVLIAKTVLK